MALLLLGASCSTLFFVASSSVSLSATSIVLPTSVHVGDSVKIPLKTLTDQGVSKVAKATITTPKGEVYSSEEIVCDEAGIYRVCYAAEFASGIQKEEETFLSIRRPNNLFSGDALTTFENGSFSSLPTYKGVIASFHNGASFSFDKTIDLTSLSSETPLLEMMVLPSKEGASDFSKATIVLSDVEDTSKTITISLTDSGGNIFGRGCYVKAAANGQVLSGWEFQQLHTDAEYGTPIESSFRGLSSSQTYRPMSFYYDYGEKCLYGSPSADWHTPKKTVIVDFDDKNAFPSSLWSGFTSGKVKMTFTPGGLTSATGRILFHSVAGYSLSSSELLDTAKPKISVDYGSEKEAPSAVVGYDYPLFAASSQDDYDDGLVVNKRVVYLDPTSQKEVSMAVQNDKFHVLYAGEYHLLYEVADRSGNKESLALAIFTSTSAPSLSIEGAGDNQNVDVFSSVSLPKLSTLSVSGGYGESVVSRKVKDPSGQEVKVVSDAFVPLEVGTYTVDYSAQDYLGFSGKKTISIIVHTVSHPSFVGSLQFPKVYLSGFTYDLPSFPAKEIVDGKTVDVSVSVSVNGASMSKTFVASGTSAQIVYTASGSTGNVSQTFVVPVQDGKLGKDQVPYFYGEKVTVSEERNDVVLSATQDAETLFANPLSTANFSISLSRVPEKENLNAYTVSLSDAADLSIAATMKIRFLSSTSASIVYPGSDDSFTASCSDGVLLLNYQNGAFYDASGNSVGRIKLTDSLDAFEGFSDKVYVGFGFHDVKGESDLKINVLNNQPMGYRSANPARAKDSIKPTIQLAKELVQKYAVSSTISLPSAKAYDVLNPVTNFTLSVTAPDGSVLIDKGDPSEEKSITLSSFGQYTVIYSATDLAGNTLSDERHLSVIEYEAPTLKVDFSSLQSVYDLSSAITLPSYTLKDNAGESNLDIFLLMPNNELRLLVHVDQDSSKSINRLASDDPTYSSSFKAGDKAFNVLEKGHYTLRYFAYDSYFNCASQEFSFSVR